MALKFTRLTRRAVRSLQPGERLNEHGIIAERLANGDVRYSLNIMADGVRIHRVIGRESERVTREQAERAIENIRTKAREGRLDLPKGRKVRRTFAEAAKEYLTRLEESGGKNLKAKEMHLRLHLIPHFGTQRADNLNEFGLKTYRVKRRATGASDATVNREMATLSHMLKSAVRWGWFRPDCLPNIDNEKEPQQPIVVLSQSQSAALMEAALQDKDARLWLFVMFGLGAAMRHREILSVRYDQINFASRRVFIPEAKAGEREQPITPALAEALERQKALEDDTQQWVFPALIPTQSKAGHRTSMARPFARAVAKAGLDPEKVTPHTMRRTAITRLVKAGVDLPTIQRISGHKTLAMVLRYVNVHGDHIDNAIIALDAGFSVPVTLGLHRAAFTSAPVYREAATQTANKSVVYEVEVRSVRSRQVSVSHFPAKGVFTGNSIIFDPACRLARPTNESLPSLSRAIPYATEQGIFSSGTG